MLRRAGVPVAPDPRRTRCGRIRDTRGRGQCDTSRVKKVIEMAFKICSEMAHPRVGTGHILLALSAEGEGIGAHVLNDLGAAPERIDAALRGLADLED
ncbi:MAG: hypothetical protein E6I39_03525 [Chloroflexi bacterium]|nr:MAG: hypothetical protein E6I39_03525 [Chloroflexota bacterium]